MHIRHDIKMVTCVLDNNVAGDLMGWKLPAWQSLLLHRVLPSCGGLIVYLTMICFDLALIFEHFQNGSNSVAVFSIILMVIPALLTFIFTLTSPPSGLQLEVESSSVEVKKNDICWVLLQIFNLLLFPIAAIGSYCHQIFWWIESVFAARTDDDDRAQDAIQRARNPSSMELYLFLQAFLHAAPHIILNLLEMMAHIEEPIFEKVSLQFVSVIVSSLRMASTATIYRRFEREKICGRHYPWHEIDSRLEDKLEEAVEYEENNKTHRQDSILIPCDASINDILTEQEAEELMYARLELIRFSDSESNESINSPVETKRFSPDNSDDEYVKPISIIDRVAPDRRSRHNTERFDSDDEYVKPISIIDRVAPDRRSRHNTERFDSDDEYMEPVSYVDNSKRNNKQYKIESVHIPPPPATPAPTPGRISIWAEKLVENAESIPGWLSAPPRRKYCDEVIQAEPDIPRRIPRAYMRGLEPQDASAALMHYLGWYAFFIARLMSIAVFITLYPVAAIVILFSHYQVMLLCLIVPPASTVRRAFYIFLAFICLFCLMEFKVRFRHVRVWHVFWAVVCTLEIVLFTALWATIDNNLNFWWRDFAVMVVFISLLLSYICMTVYFVILKPRETIIYIDKRSKYYGYK